MVVRERETSKRKPWGRNRILRKCKESPTVILAGVFLLYVLVAPRPSASWPIGAMLATVGGGWRAQQEDDPGCKELVADLRSQIASLMKLRVAYGEMYCEKHGIGPTGGFCVKSAGASEGGNHMWDKHLCARMADIFADSRVLDLGCGLGWYGKCLEGADKNIHWTGLDGSEGIERVTDGYVKFADLTIPQHFGETYDWVVSLEVGEHIPPEHEEVFVGNLVRHAEKGILLSWAVEGQVGHFHVNTHNNDYVIEMMRAKGFEYDSRASQSMREVAEHLHFKNTVMLFYRE